jgi:hypothetical protein
VIAALVLLAALIAAGVWAYLTYFVKSPHEVVGNMVEAMGEVDTFAFTERRRSRIPRNRNRKARMILQPRSRCFERSRP